MITPILVIPRHQAPPLPASGCWAVANLDFFDPSQWRPRADVEQDESLLQAIPYLVLHNASGALWTYRRRGGDARVDGRMSCGIGGHVEHGDADAAATLLNALNREIAKELGLPLADMPVARPHEALEGLGFMPADAIPADPRFELWSHLAARFLLKHP